MTTDRLEELKRVVCARLSKKDRLELLPLIDSAISSTSATDRSTEDSTVSTSGKMPNSEIERAIALIREKRALVYGAINNQETPECDRPYLWKNIRSYETILSILQVQIKPEHTECPHCSGSGVVQEYDDLDRYHVFTCSYCEGTGEQAQITQECEWIPVTERLPKEGQTVEIRKTSDYYTAIYRPSENQFIPWELLDESGKRTMLWRRREVVNEWREL